jgi:transcriptional regulator with XRE-family HTH domain
MIIQEHLTDDAVLKETGSRIQQLRVNRGFTQVQLAEQAGVSSSTVVRLEAGNSVQTASCIRILRVLGLLPKLDLLVPEQQLRPMELLRGKTERRRASRSSPETADSTLWKWGDER